MIFFYENQFDINNLTNIKKIKAFTYKEASLIYKSLYHLPELILKDITGVVFFIDAEIIDSNAMCDIIKEYSADIDDYPNETELMYEIWNWFPTKKETIKKQKREIIENLIKQISIKHWESVAKKGNRSMNLFIKSNFFLFVSSLIKTNSFSIIKALKKEQTKIICDNHLSYSGSDIYSDLICRDKYVQIYEELNEIALQYNKIEIKPWKIRDYKPNDPLNYFNNGFFDKLLSQLSQEDINKKIHFYGKDSLLADRAIELLLRGERPKYYSMPTELKHIIADDKAIVIQNFDNLDDPNDLYDLHERVQKIEDVFYIILKAIRMTYSKHFSYYDTIEIPAPKEIRKHITGIFLSLLLEKNNYKDDYWKLYALVETNLLEKIIPETDNLEILFKSIAIFSNLSFNDLLFNVGFWYTLEEQVKREIEAEKIKLRNYDPIKITIENENDVWSVYNLGKIPPIHEGDFIGLIYALIIIEAKREISSTEIIDISVKYRDTKKVNLQREETRKRWGYSQIGLLESDRSTVSGALSRLKSKNKYLEPFVRAHILPSSEKGYFYFDSKGLYTVEILPENLLRKHF